MRKALNILVLVLISLFMSSCLTDDTLSNTDDFQFPAGFKWTVLYKLSFSGLMHKRIVTRVIVRDGGYTVWKNKKVRVVRAHYMDSNEDEEYYFLETDTALYLVGMSLPVPPPARYMPQEDSLKLQYHFGGKVYNRIDDIVRLLRTEAFIAGLLQDNFPGYMELKFPLEQGQTWNTQRFGTEYRTVVGQDIVETPSGSFLAWKIKTESTYTWEITDFYDWVTGDLWVKRYIRSENPAYDPNGNFVGYVILETQYEIENFY